MSQIPAPTPPLLLLMPCPSHTDVPARPSAQSVKSTNEDSGKVTYPVSAINVLKAHGKSARESALLNGYALNMGRASQGMPKRVAHARIACLDMNLQKTRMHMGIQARSSSPVLYVLRSL